MAQVITAAIEKGGTSKTTTIVNLAALAAADKKKVLVVDMDKQANATYMLTGYKKETNQFRGCGLYNMYRAYGDEMDVHKYISPTKVAGVDIIASNAQTPQAVGQLELLSQEFGDTDYRFLAYCLAGIADEYDYVFIDTAPEREVLALSAINASDYVVVPCRTDELSLEGFETTMKMVEQLNKDEGDSIQVLGILITAYERLSASQYILDKIKDSEYGELLFNTKIRKGAVALESTILASPVVVMAKNSNVARDYKDFYKEMKKRIAAWEAE